MSQSSRELPCAIVVLLTYIRGFCKALPKFQVDIAAGSLLERLAFQFTIIFTSVVPVQIVRRCRVIAERTQCGVWSSSRSSLQEIVVQRL